MYELRDLANKIIDGIFYEQELARVEKNLDEEQFIVDRMIKTRGRGANKQVLVSWRGYPSKFDSGIEFNFSSRWRGNNFFWYSRVTVVCAIFLIIQRRTSSRNYLTL